MNDLFRSLHPVRFWGIISHRPTSARNFCNHFHPDGIRPGHQDVFSARTAHFTLWNLAKKRRKLLHAMNISAMIIPNHCQMPCTTITPLRFVASELFGGTTRAHITLATHRSTHFRARQFLAGTAAGARRHARLSRDDTEPRQRRGDSPAGQARPRHLPRRRRQPARNLGPQARHQHRRPVPGDPDHRSRRFTSASCSRTPHAQMHRMAIVARSTPPRTITARAPTSCRPAVGKPRRNASPTSAPPSAKLLGNEDSPLPGYIHIAPRVESRLQPQRRRLPRPAASCPLGHAWRRPAPRQPATPRDADGARRPGTQRAARPPQQSLRPDAPQRRHGSLHEFLRPEPPR